MWCEEDSYPEYYYEDPDYKDADNLSDIRVLRFLKTYHYLVSQRYLDDNPFPYRDFKINSKGRQLRLHGKGKYFTPLCKLLDKLGDQDPAYFVAYLFERWVNSDYYHIFLGLEWEETSGVQFPSVTAIIKEGKELMEEFLALPNYKPRNFIPQDEHRRRRKEAVENRMKRWCSAHDKTPLDYWLHPHHLSVAYMPARDLDYADSFWALDAEFQKKFGQSAQEIRDGFVEFEEALEKEQVKLFKKSKRHNDKLRKENKDPEYSQLVTIPNEDFLDQYSLDRIEYLRKAMAEGKDITTEEFEQEMEDTINPIDFDHADTVMYFNYGVGDKPRRIHDGRLSE